MTAATRPGAATWEDFEALGDEVRAEYIDGEIRIVDMPSLTHQLAVQRLTRLIEDALPPEYLVVTSFGWKPGADLFGPDLMVVRHSDLTGVIRFTGTPVLCIEVTSSNAANDYVTKAHKYAAAGLDRYWILSPADHRLDVLTRVESHYELTHQVFDEPSEVDLGVAQITVDLNRLLA